MMLLHFNDLHRHLEAFIQNDNSVGGMARIATTIQESDRIAVSYILCEVTLFSQYSSNYPKSSVRLTINFIPAANS